MPIYTEPYLGTGQPLDFSEYKPSTSQVLVTAFEHALATNPLQSLDLLSRTKPGAGGSVFGGMDDFAAGGLSGAITEGLKPEPAPMTKQEQEQYIRDSGMEGFVDPRDGYNQDILDTVIGARKEELARSIVSDRETGLQTLAGLSAGLAASIMDPINLASSVIPVPGAGSARVLSLLAKSGPWGRAGVYAASGAASGAFGAALVEPLVYNGQQAAQADYTLANSLMNIGFGAAMGAGMGMGSGFLRERLNARTGRPQDWEYAPPSKDTEARRQDLEKRMFEARKDAVPEAQWQRLRDAIHDDVTVYDSFVRHAAFKEQIVPELLYDRYGIDVYSGRIFDSLVEDAQGLVRRHEALGKELADVEKQAEEFNLGEIRDPATDRNLQELQVELRDLEERLPEALRIIEADEIIGQEAGGTLYQSALPPTAHPAASPTGSPRAQGDSLEILVNNTISTKGEAAHYEVRELDDIIASHDPNSNFRKRLAYPEKAQERPYHSDEGEQAKVRDNAKMYDPRHVISTDSTAIGGPPIIRQDGVVLGGNSRAMTLDLIYGSQGHAAKAQAYRELLLEKAQNWFGIDPRQIEAMKKPVLVRVLEADLDEAATIAKSREYNQTLTQEIQELARGVSLGKKISRDSGNALAKGLREFDGNLTAFLGSKKSLDFVDHLVADGVIMETELSAMLGKDGLLAPRGKNFVRNALRGRLVPDYEILKNLPDGVLQRLDAIAPQVIQGEIFGPEWSLGEAVFDAARLMDEAKTMRRKLKAHMDSYSLTPDGKKRFSERAKTLALTLQNAKAQELKARMESYMAQAEKAHRSTGDLMGATAETPWDVFARNFTTDLVFVGEAKFTNFRPAASASHEALHWAIANGNKTVTEAQQALELLLLKNQNADPEIKAKYIQLRDELAKFDGELTLEQPKLQGFIPDEAADRQWRIDRDTLRAAKEALEKERAAKQNPPTRQAQHSQAAQPEPAAQPAPVRAEPDEAQAPGQAAKPASQETTAPEQAARQISHLTSNRASVTFIENHWAVIRFFEQADLTSGSHELYHVIARQLEDLASRESADPYWKAQWQKANEFVGAENGQVWTREMHEKFA